MRLSRRKKQAFELEEPVDAVAYDAEIQVKRCLNPECGRENVFDANFCIYCRTPFGTEEGVGFQQMSPDEAQNDRYPGAGDIPMHAKPIPTEGETPGEARSWPTWDGLPASLFNLDADQAQDVVPATLRALGEGVSVLLQRQEALEAQLLSQAVSLTRAEDAIGRLSARFDEKVARNEYEATVLKSMSDEVQQYREGLYQKLSLPLLRDMIVVRDALGYLQGRGGGTSSEEPVTMSDIEAVRDMLADSLNRNEVEIERPREGGEFVSSQHRIVGTVPTTDAGLVGRIAEISNESYKLGDRYISPALVKVYAQAEAGEGIGEALTI